MNTGIYLISSVSGKTYVGSAVNFKLRWTMHLTHLRHNKHHSPALQRAFDKYGENGLVFKKLLICEKKDLLFYEQRAMDVLKPEYNVRTTAGSPLGTKQSLETIAKRVAKNIGKKRSEESLSNMRAAWTPEKRENARRVSEIRAKPIRCVETGQVFASQKAALRWCVEQGLTQSCKGKGVVLWQALRSGGRGYGYHWVSA